jgi:uncharacterized protein (TIGR02271 family)
MAKTVVGLMDTSQEAEGVVRDLVATCGCDRADIGMMARGSQGEVSGGAGTSGNRGDETGSRALKGAGTGAAVGGVVGLVAGVAALAIPGVGPIIAAGPIASALAGAGIGAAAGGVIGALANLGVPEEEAHYYAEGVRRGGTLVTVSAASDDAATCAAQVMREHGAVDIEHRAAQWKERGWSGQVSAGEEQVIPVTEEELAIGKREVGRGAVKVYSRVIETPVEEKVSLREEHVQVERRPVDRPISAGDEAFQEKTIEVREMAEEPVVQKRARITEEVRVGKQATQREQTIRDKVKKTDVQVENTAEARSPIAGSAPSAYRGPERRKTGTQYQGQDRRAAMR